MNSPHWTDRLSEYLDGDLAAPERAACEAHLAGCAECARVFEELKAVVAEARALPPTPPPAELWSAIESRLETPVLRLRPRAELRARLARRWSFSVAQLGAAAAVIVAVTAGVMWFAARGLVNGPAAPARDGAVAIVPGTTRQGAAFPGNEAPAREETTDETASPAPLVAAREREIETERPDAARAARASRAADLEAGVPAVAADFGVRRYDAAIAELESALDVQRARLDSSTVRIVENNLAIIDKAIADARKALEADPSNRYLNAYLASTMRRKVDMLRRVNSLARI